MSGDGAGQDRDRIPRVPLNIRFRRHRGQCLVIGYENTLELSPTAVFIWRQIDGRRSAGEIAQVVSAEYGIDETTAVEDVNELLTLLAEHELVLLEAASG